MTRIIQRSSWLRGITSRVVSEARTTLRSAACASSRAEATSPTFLYAAAGRLWMFALRQMLRGTSTRPYPSRNTPATMPKDVALAMEKAATPERVMAPLAVSTMTPSSATATMTA